MIKNLKYMREFHTYYTRAVMWAALGLGVIHAVQALVIGFATNRSIGINPTVFAVLIPYELFQSMIFFLVGWIIAYAPSVFLFNIIRNNYVNRLSVYVIIGVALGVIFIPLCASVPYFLLKLPDEPDYLTRCAEFSLPMTIAGAIGGYTFWRCARGSAGKGALAADQFS